MLCHTGTGTGKAVSLGIDVPVYIIAIPGACHPMWYAGVPETGTREESDRPCGMPALALCLPCMYTLHNARRDRRVLC